MKTIKVYFTSSTATRTLKVKIFFSEGNLIRFVLSNGINEYYPTEQIFRIVEVKK